MYYNDGYFSPASFILGPVFMVIFWVFILWVGVTIFRNLSHLPRHDHDRALEILKERYVKGEITKEQFETMKKDISK